MTTASTIQPVPAATPVRKASSGGATPAAATLAVIDPMKLLQQYYPWLIASGVLGVIFGLGSFYALKEVYPIWESDVTYEVRSVAENSTDPISGRAGSREDMEAYMNTMARVARSDTILSKAIEEKAVRETVWARQFTDASGNIDAVAALKKLRKIVSTRAIPDTNIMQLVVGTHHKDDAPNIATAISNVFLDDTGSRSGKDMRDLIQQFENVARDLGKDIEQIDARIEALMAKEKMTSLRQESTVHYTELGNLQPALVRMRETYQTTKQQHKSYEEMLNNPGGPIFPEAIREEVERKPIVMERDATIASLKAALRSTRESFGENHREVQLIKRRLSAEQTERDNLVNQQMAETFTTVVDNLANSLKNQEASMSELEDRLQIATLRLESTTQALKQYDDWAIERTEKVQKKSEMEKNVAEMRLLQSRGSRVRVLSNAQIPDSLAFPKIIPTTILGAFLCTGLAAGLIALKEIREQRIRGPHDVALIPRTRVLGLIPELSMDPTAPDRAELVARDRPTGLIAESVRQIRANLMKELNSRGMRTVMVVGGLPGSGSSSLVSNLAVNAAATDLRVLIVDANLRRPSMHSIFGMSDAPGLTDLLLGNATIDQAVRATSVANVSMLPCGKRDVPVFERFTGPVIAGIFRDLKQRYDLVLVDSTPGVVAGDAVAIATHCDAVVLVVRALCEKRGLVARLRNQLGETGAEFLGVIVNAVKPSAGGYFKRNFQVTHEYGREGTSAKEKNGKPVEAKPEAKA
ncbi:MAG: polysaccharide biosynthesis tyrosine autokinase [Phycisphaerae bacterium]|nr:polysaccharide biosynthesis tyrosine autokinase [Phycisphaerae bacterium]